MYPIIVLEGPDGAGKTFLGHYLAEKMKGHYMHLTYRFRNRMFTYHTAALERAIKIAQHKPVIIDRWWPSINIYDDVFRKKRSDPMAGRLLDRAGLAQGVIYVACIPSDREQHFAEFEERKAAGGEMYDTVVEVADKYVAWNESVRHRIDVVQYDRFKHGRGLDGFYEILRQRYFMLNNRIPPWFQNNRLFAGQSINPLVMIIGEKSNPKGRHKVWPFFEQANSSLWITETLEEAGLDEYNIVWANAIDSEGWTKPVQLAQLQRETGVQRIIALGGKAEKVAMAAGLANMPGFEKLPHPAYVKRFMNGDRSEYLRALGA